MLGFGPLSSLPISTIDPTPPRPAPVIFEDWALASPTITRTVPAYPYLEYNDDDDIRAFFDAYNALVQGYVDWFASIGLPIYTTNLITGTLLDWVAQTIYGQARPLLPSGRPRTVGPFNTWAFNTLAYNTRRLIGSANYFATSDDIFKRIITWNYYKGDGYVFDVSWLKRRIMRFLLGVSGTAPNIDNTYQISATFSAPNLVFINILNGVRSVRGGALFGRFAFNTTRYNQLLSEFEQFAALTDAPVLVAAINARAVQLPFQYQFIVTIENGGGSTGFFNNGGVLGINTGEGYPTDDIGLPPGSIWSNGGNVSVVPGISPDPLAPPVYYGIETPAGLLALGGGNLPLDSGIPGSGQLWNNGGEVAIS